MENIGVMNVEHAIAWRDYAQMKGIFRGNVGLYTVAILSLAISAWAGFNRYYSTTPLVEASHMPAAYYRGAIYLALWLLSLLVSAASMFLAFLSRKKSESPVQRLLHGHLGGLGATVLMGLFPIVYLLPQDFRVDEAGEFMGFLLVTLVYLFRVATVITPAEQP